jgi:hypothetical protein
MLIESSTAAEIGRPRKKAQTAMQVRDELIKELPGLLVLGKRLAALQRDLRQTPEYKRWHVLRDTVAEDTPEWFALAAVEDLAATLDETVRDLNASARHLAADTNPELWAAAPERARLAHEKEVVEQEG